MKTFHQFLIESKTYREYERTRHEDDTYQTVSQKLRNPRLRKLRILFNRELKRHTV